MAGKTFSFGQTLRLSRIARGLTIDEVAAKSGRNPGYLSTIERDKVNPSAAFLSDVAPFYGCPWWNVERNRLWLQSLAWIYGNTSVLNIAAGGAEAVRGAVAQAMTLGQILVEASTLSEAVQQRVGEVLERLQLPGIKRIMLDETVPILAWVVASLDVNMLQQCNQDSVVDKAQCILTTMARELRSNAVGVDSIALGVQVRRLRLAKGWTPENVALLINRMWEQTHPNEPLVDTTYVLEIEEGTAAVNMDVLSAIAHVFDVTPSSLLANVDSAPLPVTESDVVEVLRGYGLSDGAIASLRELLAFLRHRH
uniref:HTH cro/C1-type domain-containing protein n=1 Tax=Sulfobacillus thermotolerans TaxID=338644 RepID=G5CJ50_9FIRM|nr:helix-turn-helix transcriptional regulator [Sulfobacillus thermotolerans]AEP14327.1 hypothetical protein [Sulfobacillus thermotolerans]